MELFPAIVHFLSNILPRLGFLAAATFLHETLLHSILRLPGTFFDVTPKGRILARVSKDVDVVDSDLPRVLDNFIYVAFKVMISLEFEVLLGFFGIFKVFLEFYLRSLFQLPKIFIPYIYPSPYNFLLKLNPSKPSQLLPAISLYLGDIISRLEFILAAKSIHKALLENIMRFPADFFDVTPRGRILSRMSIDVEIIDSDLPRNFQALILLVLKVKFILYNFLVFLSYI